MKKYFDNAVPLVRAAGWRTTFPAPGVWEPQSGSARFTIGVLVLLMVLICVAAWLWGSWSDKGAQETESLSNVLRNFGLLIGGFIALLFGVWRARVAERQADASQGQVEAAQRQADTVQLGLLNERYQRGAEMLGHGVLAVRMGGIYALQRLAEEHPELYHVQIVRLLCAFVRNPTPDEATLRQNDRDPLFDIPAIPEDVQAAISVVGLRDSNMANLEQETGLRLDLRRANLRFADLRSHNFPRADFSNAFLKDANLDNADLTGAILMNTNLSVANVRRTKFNASNCLWADFSSIDGRCSEFVSASLEGTDFTTAILENAVFREAHFSGTRFGGAELKNADISGARFTMGRQRSGVPPYGIDYGHVILTEDQLNETFATAEQPPVIDQDVFMDEPVEP